MKRNWCTGLRERSLVVLASFLRPMKVTGDTVRARVSAARRLSWPKRKSPLFCRSNYAAIFVLPEAAGL